MFSVEIRSSPILSFLSDRRTTICSNILALAENCHEAIDLRNEPAGILFSSIHPSSFFPVCFPNGSFFFVNVCDVSSHLIPVLYLLFSFPWIFTHYDADLLLVLGFKVENIGDPVQLDYEEILNKKLVGVERVFDLLYVQPHIRAFLAFIIVIIIIISVSLLITNLLYAVISFRHSENEGGAKNLTF